MSAKRLAFAISATFLLASSLAARVHADEAPGGTLGKVSFPTSCAPAVQPTFERAVAMLHSFWYTAGREDVRGHSRAGPRLHRDRLGLRGDPDVEPACGGRRFA